MIGLKNGLFDFQEDCSKYLLDVCENNEKKITIIKAPTGSGKTIILIDFIDKYFDSIDSKVVFIWLCPGKGDLEEQSKIKMLKYLPYRNSANLFDVITNGFEGEETVFINWELITNKRNKAITESERKNLFERIAEAHRDGLKFILIIDEEHSNDTKKARDIINSFSAIQEIRVSATPQKNKLVNYYEIPEIKVIETGLITKALYINEGVESNSKIEDEHKYLIDLANNKRKEILRSYKKRNLDINPLILIQFPDESDDLIVYIEKYLSTIGYTYESGMVAKWMSDEKINIKDIEKNNAEPIFLLMKQAISVGWDCPRAKVLVKLRENMTENFTIQTIGRIRRMPEAKHYDDDLLDNCFLYTFDEKYKESIKNEISSAFEVKRVKLKDKCKTFTLEKQLKDLDNDGLGEREAFYRVYKFLFDKYSLSSDLNKNKIILEANGYRFEKELIRKARQGKFVRTDSILDLDIGNFFETRRDVNTHKNGIELMHSIDLIKSSIGIKHYKLRTILERLFRVSKYKKNKIVELSTTEFYAFISKRQSFGTFYQFKKYIKISRYGDLKPYRDLFIS